MTTTTSYVIVDDKTNFPIEVCFSEDYAEERIKTLRNLNGFLGPRHSFRVVSTACEDITHFVRYSLSKELASEVIEKETISKGDTLGNLLQMLNSLNTSFVDYVRSFCKGKTHIDVVREKNNIAKVISQLIFEKE